ncbi:heterokaryon incompatibility protein-domain-containing protein, partial [Bisporella sp. PMI_857]
MYEYELLDAKSDLRLLILEMGGTSDPIKCRLVRARFARRPFYEALSYTWGSADQKKQIWLHGQRTDVRSNLWSALFKLRRNDKNRLLWVDALCINQRNVNERNHQVALMKEIFTQAAEVIVWLGPEADDSDLAMDFLYDASSRYAGPSTLDVPTHKALRKLCNRDYWKRMWILQEVSLAKHLTV